MRRRPVTSRAGEVQQRATRPRPGRHPGTGRRRPPRRGSNPACRHCTRSHRAHHNECRSTSFLRFSSPQPRVRQDPRRSDDQVSPAAPVAGDRRPRPDLTEASSRDPARPARRPGPRRATTPTAHGRSRSSTRRTAAWSGTVHSADEADVAAAVQAAVAGVRRLGRHRARRARGALLHAMADGLAARADEVAALNTRETGKPAGDARGGVDAAVGTLRQYAELGPLHRDPQPARGRRGRRLHPPRAARRRRRHHPLERPGRGRRGLVGAALVTGNTVIHKPSERCPHVGALLGEIWSAPLPDGRPDHADRRRPHGRGAGPLGRGPRRRPRRLDRDRPGHRAEALHTGAHLVLENGGNDALVVDADVDPAWAAGQAALGAYANSGQICTSVERIYVHADVADAFVDGARRRGRPAQRRRHGPAGRHPDAGRGAPPGRRGRGRGRRAC